MALVDTNEGRGEDNELTEWLEKNRLTMAKNQFLKFEVSIQDLVQLEDKHIELR